ncbi:MAG TPA: prephenate dehydratase domain-containing protein [Candidatus Micrarchaeia archaeon]|nr:prephenate dehydratase domain-containing protein [Candidatus Micrarchaeia archaeon]
MHPAASARGGERTSGTRFAYQGEPGAFSEEMIQAIDPTAWAVPYPTFALAVTALVAGEVVRAVLPVENSLGGVVQEVSDQLTEHPVRIVAEHRLPVRHCLLVAGDGGGDPPTVTRVRSHPQALAQCRRYLERIGAAALPAGDTAGAARALAERPEPGVGVIASAAAARRYGLRVVATDIQDHAGNTTRFVTVARGAAGRPTGQSPVPGKVSLTVETSHRPGSLHAALGVFASRHLNLTRLDSRPIPDRTFEYRYYLDFEYDEAGRAAAALDALVGVAHAVQVLGVYAPVGADAGAP